MGKVITVGRYFYLPKLHNQTESGKVDDFNWQTISNGVFSIQTPIRLMA
jgi:hypothetical protein